MSESKKIETKKYVVTQKHCLDYKIDQVVELTEDKAKKLANKVELYVPKVVDDSDQDLVDALARIEELEAEIKALKNPVKKEADKKVK